MAYNYKYIEAFLNKVNKEAEQAAQAVFEKYEAEFLKKVQAQLMPNDIVWHGMGACVIQKQSYADSNKCNVVSSEVGKNLSDILGEYQYFKITHVGMTLPYKFNKYKIFEK